MVSAARHNTHHIEPNTRVLVGRDSQFFLALIVLFPLSSFAVIFNIGRSSLASLVLFSTTGTDFMSGSSD